MKVEVKFETAFGKEIKPEKVDSMKMEEKGKINEFYGYEIPVLPAILSIESRGYLLLLTKKQKLAYDKISNDAILTMAYISSFGRYFPILKHDIDEVEVIE